MSIGRLHYHKVTGLQALARSITENSLAGILEAHLEKVIELLLIHSLKPVIYLELAASLTVSALCLSSRSMLYNAAT
jgi:hypothetical protein